MKGIIFALLGGFFVTLQGVANAQISQNIGTWQATTLTQLTGFLVALVIVLILKEQKNFRELKNVKPLYMISGTFGAIVVYSNVVAIQLIGVTVSTAAILIAQLVIVFLIDIKGWFGVEKQQMKIPQFIGFGMMILGVVVLSI